MGFDTNRQAEKREELVTALRDALLQHGDIPAAEEAAGRILDVFACITPPEEGDVYMEMITAASFSGRGGGRSSKPGNIRLNMRLLLEAIASGTFTVVSLKDAPWAAPFAAIMLWNSVWRAAQVELTEQEVAILWTMWRIRDSDKCVKESLLLPAVSEHVAKHGLTPISESDVRHGLERLAKIETIARSRRSAGEWRLIEWVQKSYQ